MMRDWTKRLWQFLPGLVILLGFGLRLYQVGKDSFWADEAGVAIAVQRPSLFSALEIARTHEMAMPLDYVVDWVTARACTSEGCLRFPSVVWGTLTLWAAYRLFRRIGGERLALFGLVFLALSPFHIRYSQETRFYASMLFFYVLASDLLLAAIQGKTWPRWVVFTLVTIIGVYFHVYVILALANGFFWLLFTKPIKANRRVWIYYFASALVVVLAFLPGYFLFANHLKTDYPLTNSTDTVLSLMVAWGWLPNYAASGLAWIWFGLFAFLSLIGLYWVIRQPRWPVVALLISIVVQSGFIILTDLAWNYFVVDRQFLIAVPMVCFLSAVGFSFITRQEQISPAVAGSLDKKPNSIQWPSIILTASIGVVLVMSYIPAVSGYYQLERSHAREIGQWLSDNWSAGQTIYVYPSYQIFMFQYYLQRSGRADIVDHFTGTTIKDLPQTSSSKGRDFLITPATPPQAAEWITQLGFVRVYPIDANYTSDAQFLWGRGP